MPRFTMNVPHALGQDEAVRRLKERFQAMAEAYQGQVQGLQQDWEGGVLKFAFRAMGISVGGTVTAEPAEVKVETELPLMAMAFKGAIESQLRAELAKILA